uniref:C-type lectin domain-containing protein n=1 Tax=Anabas testudineus TaxID=64144 RepID=A0A3Q1JLF6_ANATE
MTGFYFRTEHLLIPTCFREKRDGKIICDFCICDVWLASTSVELCVPTTGLCFLVGGAGRMIRSCLSDKNPSSSFVFVYLAMSWTGAQQYCRDHYTDLASVRNQTENDQMKKMTVLTYTWIGLYRDSWKWTDGSPLSCSNWVPGLAPTAAQTDTCAASDVGKWINLGCSVKFYFVCFAVRISCLFPLG